MPRKPARPAPMIAQLMKKIAPRIGAKVLLEPRWNVVGQITFKNGKKSYFRSSSLDVNTMGASAIAKDKGYATFFMKRLGFSTIPGDTFYSDGWAKAIRSKQDIEAAWRYAQRLTLPVVVKPNSGSQGSCVACVHDKRSFFRAMKAIFKRDHIALVQKPVIGQDYRLVVLKDQVISAYERIPLSVVGNGRSSIAQLLEKKFRQFKKEERPVNIKLDEPRLLEKLARERLKLSSIPQRGQTIFLLDNANLSSGGDSIDVTNEIHADFRKIAVDLTREMGLRLCGVDLMVAGDIREPAKKYWVLEINSAPGLDHYAKNGRAQQKIVENLYLEVLKSMET